MNINILVQIHKTVPVEIYGDRFRLEHVMNNLLSNAIKFSPDNGSICLSLSYETKTVNSLTFAVRDYGPGISDEDKKQLFKPFMQVRPGELQKGRGSGLGLSICKNMVKLHMGSIDCQSTVRSDPMDVTSGGSEFFFTILTNIDVDSIPFKISSIPVVDIATTNITTNTTESTLPPLAWIDPQIRNECSRSRVMIGIMPEEILARGEEFVNDVDMERSSKVKGEMFRSRSTTFAISEKSLKGIFRFLLFSTFDSIK